MMTEYTEYRAQVPVPSGGSHLTIGVESCTHDEQRYVHLTGRKLYSPNITSITSLPTLLSSSEAREIGQAIIEAADAIEEVNE